MKKAIISIILILATLISVALVANGQGTVISDEGRFPFEDVNTKSWYGDAAVFCYANGIINGTSIYTFVPYGNLTRAQFVTILYNIADKGADAYYLTPFTDVKRSAWYYNALAWCYDNGIVAGTSATKFSPDAYISRQAMARMMMLYMELKGHEISVDSACLDKYADKGQIADWGREGMESLVSAGLISGVTETTVSPRSNVTRAQTARIVMLYMQNILCGECQHSFTDATCAEPSTCQKCGIIYGLPLGHRVPETYNCKQGATCLTCSQYASPSKLIHDYTPANCGKPATCKRCGVKKGDPVGEHSWWAATCTNPKMCKVCYKTEGYKLGHNFTKATCIKASRCTRCNKRNGDPLGHTVRYGTCSRCQILVKADSFDKVIDCVAFDCNSNSWNSYPIYGCMLEKDSAGAICTQTVYYQKSEGILKLKTVYELNGTTLELEIFIPKKSDSYQYTVKAYGSNTAAASGYINPATVSSSMNFIPSNYNGTSAFRNTFNTYSYRALIICMAGTNRVLSNYYSDVTYLGFVNYK